MKPGIVARLRNAGPLLALFATASWLHADAGDIKCPWAEFHGPRRDNISPDTGLLKQWPKDGPALLWKYAECGRGYPTVTIADGMLFSAGDFADAEMLIALDLDGKLLWKAENAKSWKGAMPGARAVPTYDAGVLYHLNPTGRLAAYEAKSGKEVWAVDLKKEYDAQFGTWALAENVLIDGKTLFCAPGGTKGRIVALDKATGKVLWANTDVSDRAAYCSPILVTVGGKRQLVTAMQKTIVSVDAKTGKLLWTHQHETKNDQNVTSPIYWDGRLFASSGHGTGGRLLALSPDGASVTEAWLNKDLDNCHGGVVLRDGCFFGSGCRLFGKGFVCVDFATGKTLYNEKSLGKVSITYADGMLYCLSDRARMSLVEANRTACRIVSQFDLPKESRELCLSHPVVCGGRLYVRHWNNLYVYDVRAEGR